MEKVQLQHPEGKKAISMDKNKYYALKSSFVECLKTKKTAPFKDLLSAVTADLENKKTAIKGVIEWNLFWVTLDMEARQELKKDKSVSPYMYSL
ncbi:hypothetical protein [Mucilaginibacter sp.]|uniref:DUF6958 family protein n=1 Tax=Mucilaginibacter sp. TaxID=1882438 RepID=UPI00262E709B|nr:hypothetical protein [Mucilaginibacter sp.]MDB4921437.1 hypothetical protein [Mucilaginibacter sp.]